jgi:hypothetical protein
MTSVCRRKTVAKSKEVKTRSNLTESSKNGYGSKKAALSMMMVMMTKDKIKLQCKDQQ